ncbi:hypothetical protein DRW48_12405 [Paracoccus suum]|uniref:Phage capsid-like C-terminal domain-containing protein n=1 Tax=Paracoccus suum TaxID=2259340 RepID=A0A344PLX6_9RHOB|nr:phage major capsid protein [Paracoccus suum]AXC50381.1 hypothetical protein DRW48_12405 [Paracoccus suum]
MLKSQSIQLAQSHRREKMAAIQKAEGDPSDDQIAELRTLADAYERGEVEYRAAVLTEESDRATIRAEDKSEDAFQRECRAFSLARVVERAESGRMLDGREAEVSQELEKRQGAAKQGGVIVPWAALETRADAVVTTATDDNLTSRPVIGPLERIFADSAAKRFGFDIRNVTGRPTYPEITAGATPTWVAEGAGTDAQNIATLTQAAVMRTVTARYLITRQATKENPALEDTLRRDLAGLISAELDRVAFQGQGGLEPVGILKRLTDAGRVQNVGAKASFGTLLAAAVSLWETAGLAGPDKVKIAGAPVLLQTTADDLVSGTAVSSFDRLKAAFGSPIFSPQVSPTAARDATGKGRSTVVVGAPEGLAHILLWGAPEILVDPYSESKTGKIAITTFAFADVIVQRVATHFLALTNVQDRA